MLIVGRRCFLFGIATLAAICSSGLGRFRLAVTTDEISDDLLTAIQFLKRFGLRHAELRKFEGQYNTKHSIEKIRAARHLFNDHGIKTAILDTPFFKIPLPPDTPEGHRILDSQWALLDDAMDRAEILGTDKIRTFAFTYRRGERPDPAKWPRIVELVRESAGRAANRGFRIALENVGRSYVATAKEASRILEAIPDANFGLTWDPNNSARSDGEAFPEGYARLDPARIFHIHFRDYLRLPSGKVKWCGIGEGEFDHLGQLRKLLEDDYRETISLETHYTIQGSKMRASESSIKALLKVIERV
ncbi:MAG: hypothetical protein CMN58_00460 [Solibacterales bacterium]|nr:hypothetical protein [Bryobacterales bacterium]|tara:strand:+ start:896 stop:1804 length:909 start_codon:yes stop_codon:yes gene_type:complete